MVKPVWVLNLFADRKMWADIAHAEIIRCRRDVARSVALVRAVAAAERQQQLTSLMASVSRAEQSMRRPRRECPEVLDFFLAISDVRCFDVGFWFWMDHPASAKQST